jgi:crotonobetainyl-CoA:carnitine CoA-transferase CaiB-like acyl-CoA transferase
MSEEENGSRIRAGLLSGFTVLEIGNSVAAPFAGQIFGDLGATVIKIENPKGGDDARAWGKPILDNSSAAFHALNRNKLSVTIDLKSAGGKRVLKDWARDADILIQNMRPGQLEEFGLGAKALQAVNPRLIYCDIGAYGADGPLADMTGYDPLMQAFAGIMSITGEEGRPPVRVGPSIVDIGSALWIVIGALAALVQREKTGTGCVVEGSLYETALVWMTIPIVGALASGVDPQRTGSELPMLAPYKAYKTKDSYVVLAAGNNNLFRRLSEALGHSEWAADERFCDNLVRIENRQNLNELIAAIVEKEDSAYWFDRFRHCGVPCAPVQSVSQVVAHEQTKALDMISPTPDGQVTLMRMPLRFDGVRAEIRTAAPVLGANNDLLGTRNDERIVEE